MLDLAAGSGHHNRARRARRCARAVLASHRRSRGRVANYHRRFYRVDFAATAAAVEHPAADKAHAANCDKAETKPNQEGRRNRAALDRVRVL